MKHILKLGVAMALCVSAQGAVLDSPALLTNGWVRLSGDGMTNRVHRLERSTNLVSWSERAALHHSGWSFTESSPGEGAAFYRVRSTPYAPATDDGKNGIRLPDDPFINRPDRKSTRLNSSHSSVSRMPSSA